MNFWHRLHRWPWWWRWPLKLAAFLAVAAVALYPKIWLVPSQLARWRNMNTLLVPEHPGLAELERLVLARAGDELSPRELLHAVELAVCERIAYAWDWEVWGVMDYLPTTGEVLAKGREDCDGRAVLAASLLRRMGCEAELVSDIRHTWVATPSGETMSPGAGERTFESGPDGTRLRLTSGMLANLGRALALGIAVFPLTRELVILAALCGLTMQPRSSVRRRVGGCLLLLLALGLLHDSGAAPHCLGNMPLGWAGLITAVGGWLLLAIRAADHRSLAARPG